MAGHGSGDVDGLLVFNPYANFVFAPEFDEHGRVKTHEFVLGDGQFDPRP